MNNEKRLEKEKRITKLAYVFLAVFILAILVVVNRADAAEAPETTVEALPVTCTTPENAQEVVEGNVDLMLLAGKSVVSGKSVVVLYNTQTREYVILLQVSPEKLCFVDIGFGRIPQQGVNI